MKKNEKYLNMLSETKESLEKELDVRYSEAENAETKTAESLVMRRIREIKGSIRNINRLLKTEGAYFL